MPIFPAILPRLARTPNPLFGIFRCRGSALQVAILFSPLGLSRDIFDRGWSIISSARVSFISMRCGFQTLQRVAQSSAYLQMKTKPSAWTGQAELGAHNQLLLHPLLIIPHFSIKIQPYVQGQALYACRHGLQTPCVLLTNLVPEQTTDHRPKAACDQRLSDHDGKQKVRPRASSIPLGSWALTPKSSPRAPLLLVWPPLT